MGESSHKTSLERHEEQIEEILNHLDEFSLDRIEYMEDKIEVLEKVGKQMGNNNKIDLARFRIANLEQIIKDIQVRHQADKESLLDAIYELKNSHGIIAPKRTSISEAPSMSQAAIRKLVADSVTTALEAQAANMTNAHNTNRNSELREVPVERKCSYKEFKSCQTFNFKGLEGAVGLIRLFERSKLVFSRSNCIEDCKVKFATEVKKIEDEFYNLSVKGNDLKTYVRRFQEFATLCPTMVPDSKKMMEIFIGGLPQSIEGNVTASKPQTLEEAINIA
ncbi:hypothetical protein Tco_1220071 [Tanacetum coccineum]